jgi:hypothetical protein
VNFKKLADRAQKVKTAVDAQGGTDALKEKAQKMKTAASGQGSVGDKAKAAAAVAREKPNPGAETAGDQPIGGGDAPPQVATPPETAKAPVPDPEAPTTAGSEDPSAR